MFYFVDADAYGSKHGPLFTSDGLTLIEGPFLKAMQSADSYLQKSAALSFACLLTVCNGNESALVSVTQSLFLAGIFITYVRCIVGQLGMQ